MEVDKTLSTETPPSTPQDNLSPPPAAESTPPPAVSAPDSGTPAAAAPSVYQPNLKFKVKDEEFEIDAFLKDSIKDEETEKKIKQIYSKAYGLDKIINPAFDQATQELKTFKTGVDELRDAYSRDDFDSIFSKLGIQQEKVLQWLINKAKYEELPPEQKADLDRRKQTESRASLLEKENLSAKSQIMQIQAEANQRELSWALKQPEIKSFADQFDQRAGKPGSFMEEVCKYGESVFLRTKENISAEQAVTELMSFYGKFMNSPAAVAPHSNGAPKAPGQEPPVIPNVGGKPTTPTKQRPRNIEDLKKLAAQM
jgi:hypothetical protein